MSDLKQNQPAAQKADSSSEDKKKLKQRNLAIALGLAAFMAIVFLVTIMKLGGSVAERSF